MSYGIFSPGQERTESWNARTSSTIAVDPSAFSPGFFVGIIDFSQGDEAIDYLRRSVDEATITSSGILEEET